MQTSKVIYKFRLFKKNQLSFFFLTDQRILFVFPERKFFINQTILLFSLKEIRSPTILQMVKIKKDWKEIKIFSYPDHPLSLKQSKSKKKNFNMNNQKNLHILFVYRSLNWQHFWTLVSWPENIINTLWQAFDDLR